MSDTEAWQVPDNPDPHTILCEAVADARSGKYSRALEKQLWFHEHALEHCPSMYGVRLSFALSYWSELAAKYQPAKDALLKARDNAEAYLLHDGDVHKNWHDFVSLNERLGNNDRTVEQFRTVAMQDKSIASRVYSLAEPMLVAAGRFDICNAFLDPTERLDHQISYLQFRVSKDYFSTDKELEMADRAREEFRHNVATLIAILTINGRSEEANTVAAGAQTAFPDLPLAQSLQDALAGRVPHPQI